MKFQRMLFRLQVYAIMLFKLFRDSGTPRISKGLIIVALIYILMPFDLLPDFIPFAGVLDEAIIIPLLIYIATYFIPKDVKDKYRKKAKTQISKESKIVEGEIVD